MFNYVNTSMEYKCDTNISKNYIVFNTYLLKLYFNFKNNKIKT